MLLRLFLHRNRSDFCGKSLLIFNFRLEPTMRELPHRRTNCHLFTMPSWTVPFGAGDFAMTSLMTARPSLCAIQSSVQSGPGQQRRMVGLNTAHRTWIIQIVHIPDPANVNNALRVIATAPDQLALGYEGISFFGASVQYGRLLQACVALAQARNLSPTLRSLRTHPMTAFSGSAFQIPHGLTAIHYPRMNHFVVSTD
ncbi:hypothetical protein BV898_19229 [Hypsibius exemplaris]|uniref:Uncharacterized protein n=1 Tax=Hypsibius exemplaris TaxID=2072580 RepID=A0A9X6NIW1_HYPEX|nr:hypothetical protein BV898_19229 [Hypsibius exemplaris]